MNDNERKRRKRRVKGCFKDSRIQRQRIYRTTTRDRDVKMESWFEGENKITGLVVNA